jgi:hypothetical protein
MIVKVYKMNMLIKNEIKPIKMVLLDDYNELNQRIEKASNKINNMFDRGDANTIVDDLLELDKILKGSDSNVKK